MGVGGTKKERRKGFKKYKGDYNTKKMKEKINESRDKRKLQR